MNDREPENPSGTSHRPSWGAADDCRPALAEHEALAIDEVLERYNLTLEEFASWQRAVDRSGMQGLRVTRIQHYRDLYERQLKY